VSGHHTSALGSYMFADRRLALRIDGAEARLSADFARARGPESRAIVMPVCGGLAVYAGPASPINKVIGLGFDAPLDLSSIADVEREFRNRDEPVRIELSILADATAGPTLSERGYRLHGFENALGCPLERTATADAPPDITIETLNDGDARLWAEIAVTAFLNLDGTGSVPDDGLSREQMERELRDYAALPGFVRYLAWIDGNPVGEAALRLDRDSGLAQLAGAGTLPAYRGRGVQKALLQRRLADARAAGCDLAIVTTAPGTRSQENVMRRGFALLYTRAILVRKWNQSD
jgi:N-acetylglutamate synthase-like GNAT family acetyltransferase